MPGFVVFDGWEKESKLSQALHSKGWQGSQQAHSAQVQGGA